MCMVKILPFVSNRPSFDQNVHGPTEAPQRFQDMYPNTMNPYRHKIAACMTAMDEGKRTREEKDKTAVRTQQSGSCFLPLII